MKNVNTLLLLILLSFHLSAQQNDFAFENRVYAENIQSVKFHIEGLPLSMPLIDLNSNTPLLLRFDDTDAEVKTYTYKIIHCDADWQRSQLGELEYLDGFTEETIRDYRYSFKTVIPFVHYWVQLPNQDMRWTKSGNYLLVVYEDEGQRRPVITRRFMVVDPIVQIQPQVLRPAKVSKSRTHQEIDFIVDHQQVDIRTPMTEVQAVVLQNGRWGTAVTDIKPAFVRPRQMVFDHQDKIVFPAGKEFRYLDIRSLRSRSENISLIERYQDRTEIILYKDEPRANQSYNFFEDINGNFILESFDASDADLGADYASVLFSLAADPDSYQEYELFIVGEMTSWQPQEAFRLVYNNNINAYVAKPTLKQGFYNFAYAAVPRGVENPVPDFSVIEGDWHLTENNYTVLVYYRPFGARYDRLIGARSFSQTPR